MIHDGSAWRPATLGRCSIHPRDQHVRRVQAVCARPIATLVVKITLLVGLASA